MSEESEDIPIDPNDIFLAKLFIIKKPDGGLISNTYLSELELHVDELLIMLGFVNNLENEILGEIYKQRKIDYGFGKDQMHMYG